MLAICFGSEIDWPFWFRWRMFSPPPLPDIFLIISQHSPTGVRVPSSDTQSLQLLLSPRRMTCRALAPSSPQRCKSTRAGNLRKSLSAPPPPSSPNRNPTLPRKPGPIPLPGTRAAPRDATSRHLKQPIAEPQ